MCALPRNDNFYFGAHWFAMAWFFDSLGELAAKPTERVKDALSASGTSPKGRGKWPSSGTAVRSTIRRGRLGVTDCHTSLRTGSQ